MEKRRLLNLLPIFTSTRFLPRRKITSAISHIGLSKRRVSELHSLSEPRVFPRSGWDIVNASLQIEEESIPNYRPERFYPVYIGEIFNGQYQVVGKLGYGSSATVWLCRDLL